MFGLICCSLFQRLQSDFNEASDAQPEVVTDDFIESQNIDNHTIGLPDRIKLMNSKEVMKCRKVKAVVRYHTPNKKKEPEKYFHHLLMLYFPWRNEEELLGQDQTYISMFYEPNVQTIVQFLLNSNGNSLSCLLLYRKHGSSIQQFIACLNYIITSLDIDIIFGDFNIDYFNEKNISPLKVLTESLNYVQLVNKPTFVSSESLLDHVYVKQSISNKMEVNVVSVYYSDHEAAKVTVRF